MKKLLLHNWVLKLAAAGLAVIIWFTIHHATTTAELTIYNVRVEPRTEDGWRVVHVEPDRVEVTVRGERVGVTAVSADHFLAQPTMAVDGKNLVELEIKPSDVETPGHFRVTAVKPNHVSVRVEPKPQP